MQIPTLDDFVAQLERVSGAESVDPDVPFLASGEIDSLDLMEWLYTFQEEYPEIPADESLFEDIDDTVTLRVVYERVMADVPAARAGA